MEVNELVMFISLVCNLDSAKLSQSHKQYCIESYTNCMVESNGVINRRKINECLDKAKLESKKWDD